MRLVMTKCTWDIHWVPSRFAGICRAVLICLLILIGTVAALETAAGPNGASAGAPKDSGAAIGTKATPENAAGAAEKKGTASIDSSSNPHPKVAASLAGNLNGNPRRDTANHQSDSAKSGSVATAKTPDSVSHVNPPPANAPAFHPSAQAGVPRAAATDSSNERADSLAKPAAPPSHPSDATDTKSLVRNMLDSVQKMSLKTKLIIGGAAAVAIVAIVVLAAAGGGEAAGRPLLRAMTFRLLTSRYRFIRGRHGRARNSTAQGCAWQQGPSHFLYLRSAQLEPLIAKGLPLRGLPSVFR